MKLFDVREGEPAKVALSAFWFFLVLGAYYVLRPVRETFFSYLSKEEQARLFVMTLVVMLVVMPLYGLAISRIPRRLIVAFVYGFFACHLLGFAGFASNPPSWLSQVFFVWLSVFNLFVVTLFWGSVVDHFSTEQGKRLFGIIAAAGTIGQISSSWLVKLADRSLGTSGLLVCSAVLLVLAIVCSLLLRRTKSEEVDSEARGRDFQWSAAWQGAVAIARSPLLLGIALFIVVVSYCATLSYFQMNELVSEKLASEADRRAWFATLNEWTGYLTLLLQSAVVSVLLRRLGVAATLSITPLVLIAGFTALSFSPTLAVMFVFRVALRGCSFGFANPSLETLYTRVTPKEKYRAKAFVDMVGKRTGDVVGGQLSKVLASSMVTVAAIPLAVLALVVAWTLGRNTTDKPTSGVV